MAFAFPVAFSGSGRVVTGASAVRFGGRLVANPGAGRVVVGVSEGRVVGRSVANPAGRVVRG